MFLIPLPSLIPVYCTHKCKNISEILMNNFKRLKLLKEKNRRALNECKFYCYTVSEVVNQISLFLSIVLQVILS